MTAAALLDEDGLLGEMAIHRVLVTALPASAVLLALAILDAMLWGGLLMWIVLPVFVLLLAPLVLVTVRDVSEHRHRMNGGRSSGP